MNYKFLSFICLIAVIVSGLTIIFYSWMMGTLALIVSVAALGFTSKENLKQVNAAKKAGQ